MIDHFLEEVDNRLRTKFVPAFDAAPKTKANPKQVDESLRRLLVQA